MLEIILLAYLCSSLGKIIRAKGRKPLLFQFLLVISWFAGEIGGFIVGGIVQAIRSGGAPADGFDFTLYLFALGGAALATVFWFVVANLMPPVESAIQQTAGGFPGPTIGPPHEIAPPADPNNPYSPPSADR